MLQSPSQTVSDELPILLRSIPAFREIGETDLMLLCAAVKQRDVQEGEVIVRQDEPGDELFIILEGECQVYVSQETLGFEKNLSRLGAGSYFGEIVLLAGGNRTASVRALSRGRIASLDRLALLDLLSHSTSLAIAVCKGMATYVRTMVSREIGAPMIDLDGLAIDPKASCLLPPRVSAFTRAIAVAKEGQVVKVAMVDPYDAPARTFIREVLRDYQIDLVGVTQDDFDRFAGAHVTGIAEAGLADADLEDMSYINASGSTVDLGERDTAQLLEKAFHQAFKFGASDVHFEPAGECGRVRMRIDGNMAVVDERVPVKLLTHVISRLKVMSDLDITNRRLPQDGRFLLRAGPHKLETRVSVMPVKGGEKAVLRMLDPRRQNFRLDQLVCSQPAVMLLKEMFLAPSGLVLICGPTGSGKTTTLYAGLTEIWKSSTACNIVTIEDPVEYELNFATQIQVNRAVGFDFAMALRSVLRQDPDVLLVGEIRDDESAAIAVEAGTTGHLVLSSLHTDSALDSIIRLRNLGVKPYLIAAALKCVVAQRLVPRLCSQCAVAAPLTEADRARLCVLGVIDGQWAGTAWAAPGCEACRFTGSIGRVGVYEVLAVNANLRDAIERGDSHAELAACVTSHDFIPVYRYARYLIENKLVGVEHIKKLFSPRYTPRPNC